MADRPIIFSAPMVRALLEGRKTQTRRLLPAAHPKFPKHCHIRTDVLAFDPKRPEAWYWDGVHERVGASYPIRYATGDRLWVREDLVCATEQMGGFATFADVVCYAEDGTTALRDFQMVDWPWRRDTLNARFCPRWASRLTLTVTDVRVQRLQEISEADAVAEGCDAALALTMTRPNGAHPGNPRGCYRDLWDSLHGPDAWDANPWVAAISFTVQRVNIDTVPHA